jgi:dipeptidyl aminopeptidase/acylaminoacyl peptidase
MRSAEPARYVPTPAELRAGYQRAQQRQRPPIYMGRIDPHWFADNRRFWYRNDLKANAREFIVVDAEHGQRRPAFDHAKVAAALSAAAQKSYSSDRLPFDDLEFVDDGKTVRFRVAGDTWQCDLTSYACTRLQPSNRPGGVGLLSPPAEGDELTLLQPPEAEAIGPPQQRPPRFRSRDTTPSPRSPDGRWTAFFKDHNVWLRATDGKETRLSQDGTAGNAYGLPYWAPDSKTLAAFRIEPGDRKEVYLIESSPPGGGRARLHRRPYDLPGDRLTAYELNLFSVPEPHQIKPSIERIDLDDPRVHWSADGSHCALEKVDRGHQRFRLFDIDAHTGSARTLIDERAQTFLWTAHAEQVLLSRVNWLQKTPEIIYASERDGWRHLYLIDARDSSLKNRITQGDWVVRGIEKIDEDARQVWFWAGGRHADQDPYFLHFYRINFDGTHLTALTEGNGSHTVQLSPDRRYLIDTYSRVDLPPIHELRRASDGQRLCTLEQADITDLQATGWKPPEIFVAKGRDGKTDIWGILCRPRNFDPSKKYPVVENIYAGPHGASVPKTFQAMDRNATLTELGFLVVQIDGMGTAHRSKAFHDVCWQNLKDAGFPDRILWHQALARRYPYYDLDRIGIYGTSAGGQNATGALLFHPDFYKAAVAACGCHDNRMDKASWNEQWMGYPVGPQYAASSNITHAANLRGKLLLIVGEMDTNVPPESTYRLVDALVKAGKDFDFLAVPGMGHSNGGAYGVRRLQDFFVRHLHGVPPPERAETTARTPSPEKAPRVIAPPESFFVKVRERDRETARKFYAKYLDIQGMPVVAAAEVADEALERTHFLVTHLLAGRPDVLHTMVEHGTRLVIIGKDQVYTDIPEYRHHPNPTYQNERVRGTGGFDITSFGEENLLNLPLDRYDDESIALHEFCHTIDAALRRLDSTWRSRLVETYQHALARGLWKSSYAATDPQEYWAEMCQSYFDCNRVNNWNHIAIGTREQLKEYDPEGYELVRTTFRLSPANDFHFRPLRHQPSVIPPPARFKVDPYYTKFTYAREFPVLGSPHVSDAALLKANDTIRKLFAYRHDLLKALINAGGRLVVLGRDEKSSDLPELRQQTEADAVRYLEYTPERKLVVVPEENVLALASDPFAGRSMIISLFARAFYEATGHRPAIPDFDRRRDRQQYELRVKRLDVEFDHRLEKLQGEALARGLWRGTPAARDRVAYWAAGVEAYFDGAGAALPPAGANQPITTREALQAYDPDLFALVEETMAYKGHVDWRYHAGP